MCVITDCVCYCYYYYYYYYYYYICVSCDVHKCMHEWHKYNITLHNLIIMKYRGFVTYVCVVIML